MQYSAACARIKYEIEFKYAYSCYGRESYLASYQAQSLKQSYSQTKTRTSHLLSPNRDPCVTIICITV